MFKTLDLLQKWISRDRTGNVNAAQTGLSCLIRSRPHPCGLAYDILQSDPHRRTYGGLLLCTGLMAWLLPAPVLGGTQISMNTNYGTIRLELNDEKAPQTVANFLRYVREGFYDGTIFHRVIDNFMIQGGGFTRDFEQKETYPPIENEAANGLPNTRGSIAMARTNAPHSATAQFFINVKDNDFLNHRHPSGQGWGYAVFGQVVDGMDVVDEIRQVPTGPGGPGNVFQDVPQQPVVIEKVTIVSESNADTPAKSQ